MASTMLSSDKRLTPLSSPATTDSVAMPVIAAMSMSWTLLLVGMPNKWLKPALTCSTPRPSDVATPNIVPKTANMSMAWPTGP